MESNHVVPRYQRGAVSVWLMPLELVVPAVLEPAPAGLQPAAPPSELQDHASPGNRTTGGCALAGIHVRNEVAPGLRIGRGEAWPAAGIEPALSRLRRERPYPQDLTGRMVPPEVGTSGGTGYCRLPQVPL